MEWWRLQVLPCSAVQVAGLAPQAAPRAAVQSIRDQMRLEDLEDWHAACRQTGNQSALSCAECPPTAVWLACSSPDQAASMVRQAQLRAPLSALPATQARLIPCLPARYNLHPWRLALTASSHAPEGLEGQPTLSHTSSRESDPNLGALTCIACYAAPSIRWLASKFPDQAIRTARKAQLRMIKLTTNLVTQHRANIRRQAQTADQLANGHPNGARQPLFSGAAGHDCVGMHVGSRCPGPRLHAAKRLTRPCSVRTPLAVRSTLAHPTGISCLALIRSLGQRACDGEAHAPWLQVSRLARKAARSPSPRPSSSPLSQGPLLTCARGCSPAASSTSWCVASWV